MSAAYPLAPRWRRLLALAYESLLLIALLLVAGMVFQVLWQGETEGPLRRSTEFVYLISLLFGYFYWCWQKSGQTLAMKVWRIKLMSKHYQPLTLMRALLRFSLALLAYAPLLPSYIWVKHHPDMQWLLWISGGLAILPWVWSLVDKEGQLLHDRLAATRVLLLPVGTQN